MKQLVPRFLESGLGLYVARIFDIRLGALKKLARIRFEVWPTFQKGCTHFGVCMELEKTLRKGYGP